MFFEGIFRRVGAKLDYDDFSIRIPERELPNLMEHLDGITPAMLAKYQRNVLWVRDYFVYKDVWSSYRYVRKDLMGRGRAGHDAFLMLALGLEARAHQIGALGPSSARSFESAYHAQLARNQALLEVPDW